MAYFPTEPSKIRARIRRYERLLQQEMDTYGQLSDGYGKRYLLGPLYMLLGDVEGALRSYAWFEQTCPDDVGHPLHTQCWSLALYQARQFDAAATKLRQLHASNRYVLPRLLGLEQVIPGIEQGEHIREILELEDIPFEAYDLWDEAALAWAKAIYDNPNMGKPTPTA